MKILKLLAIFFGVFIAQSAYAATSTIQYVPDEYYKGVVVHIIKESPKAANVDGDEHEHRDDLKQNDQLFEQEVEIKLTTGPEKGKLITLSYGATEGITEKQKVYVGTRVVVLKVENGANTTYYLSDFDRIPWLWTLIIFFFLSVFLCAGWRGVTSFGGLISTIAILLLYIVPRIVAGANPMFTVLIGSTAVILVSMFFAHGINKQTAVAVTSTFIALVAAIGFAALSVKLTYLFGTGTEEAMYIQLGNLINIDVRGVLLGGIIIGTIGVLDDVTTAQTAAAHELHVARPGMHFNDLFARVMRVGREHIASLVNTLVLAYAGVSFPLLLLIYANNDVQPLWVVLNSQQMAEELVRTLVGSITLVLAVPLSSAIAAWYYTRHNHTNL